MPKPIAVFLDRSTLDLNDLDLNQLTSTDYDWHVYDHTSTAQTLERIQKATVVVSNKVVLDKTILDQTKSLKLISVAATGYNNIDLVAAKQRNIAVTNATAYGTPSVAQHVFTLILALSTRLNQYQSAVKAGDWGKSPMFCLLDFPITEISGKKLGIIGYGELGKGVANVAAGFGMQVLLAQRPGGEPQAGRISIPELLSQVDILSLHCPLTEATTNLIGAEELSRMKPSALLINTARGGLVDESALVEALEKGIIAGAGFDVLSKEPPTDGNPLLDCQHPNLIVTPHCAWGSQESRQRLLNTVAENIRAYDKGERINRLDL